MEDLETLRVFKMCAPPAMDGWRGAPTEIITVVFL